MVKLMAFIIHLIIYLSMLSLDKKKKKFILFYKKKKENNLIN